MPLSSLELIRYARHLTLPEVGMAGQERLRQARVLLIGAGGLGSPAALYLAAAGIGTLGIVDADRVDLTNLQRQVLHGTGAVDMPKTESAAVRLHDLNPHVDLRLHSVRLTSQNAREIVGGYDIAVDGSDNFPTRYLVNDASVLLGKPYVYGSIFRFDGQVSLFGAPGAPCYRCLFAEPPPPDLVPNCAEAGVLGVLPGIVGTLQALEAIKWILGAGESLAGRLILFDALRLRFRELAVVRDPGCAVCGDRPTVTELIDYEAYCGVGADTTGAESEISVAELARPTDRGATRTVVDVREDWEWEIARIPGSRLVPLSQLPGRLGELDPRAEIVTVCHHGQRSLTAQRLLQGAGFRARSLAGGIDAWAAEVDRGMARY
ncbi:MAG: molybdopterin-synthase adenylyltransferase MoeB [Gemmatimonadales bacterium]|nr:molybdopterin-synthase adenylyltransferase MoeB [Gemmatimonadales bacterium]